MGTVRDEEIDIKLATTVSPTSSEAAPEQVALAKTKHDDVFKEMEEVEIAERAKASTLHKIKRLSRAKSIAFSKTDRLLQLSPLILITSISSGGRGT